MRKMTKYPVMLILFSALCFSCEKGISEEQADGFIKFYGSYLMDRAGDVEVLGNGGYAICGTETSAGTGKRMVLILTDAFGNVRSGFPKYYVEEGLETGGNALIALQDGSGFLLSGFVERPVEGSQQVQKDIFVVRTSLTGEVSWQQSFGSVQDEEVLHAVEGISSGFLLAGNKMNNGNTDLMMMRVSEEGDSIRLSLNYNNPYARNSNANFLLNAGDKYLCACTFDKKDGAGTGIQILSFDDELSPYARNLSGEFNEYGMCIVDEGAGNYLVLGNRAGSGGSEMILYGIETDGMFIRNSTEHVSISESGTDLIGERIIDTGRGLVIAGTRRDGSNEEILMQFVSSSYQEEEGIGFGAAGAQTAEDIERTSDGGFVILGTNDHGGSSIISLMKTNANGEL
jgi:hypothetical protein